LKKTFEKPSKIFFNMKKNTFDFKAQYSNFPHYSTKYWCFSFDIRYYIKDNISISLLFYIDVDEIAWNIECADFIYWHLVQLNIWHWVWYPAYQPCSQHPPVSDWHCLMTWHGQSFKFNFTQNLPWHVCRPKWKGLSPYSCQVLCLSLALVVCCSGSRQATQIRVSCPDCVAGRSDARSVDL
jgi:hypothetical protein